MRIAIPLCGADIAPRFCFATTVLIVTTTDGPQPWREVARTTVDLGAPCFADRLCDLQRRGVDVILCNGFNGRFLPMAEGLGLRVVWGKAGVADGALAEALTNPEFLTAAGEPPRRRGRGRHGLCRSRRP